MAEPLPLPPLARLHELLNYDPMEGTLTWKVKRTGVTVGAVAGTVCKKHGYRRITIDQQPYPAARIAWAMYHGADPYPLTIDHWDRNRDNNRITNLAPATRRDQNLNRDNTRMGRRRSVTITYPGGGTITARSQTLAAYILGQHRTQINRALARGGALYHPHTHTPNGIILTHTHTPNYTQPPHRWGHSSINHIAPSHTHT